MLDWIARIKDAMDGWPGCLATFLNADDGSKFETEIVATGSCFLLKGSCCKTLTWNNGIQYRRGQYPGYSTIRNGPEERWIHVCPGSHCYAHYAEQKKWVLTRTPHVNAIVLLPSLCLFGMGMCNMPALKTLGIKACVVTFIISL